jgi:outer membrane receptor for ferrienterochelin and colicins
MTLGFNKYALVASALLVFAVAPAWAQNGVMTGRVTSSDGGAPVVTALVQAVTAAGVTASAVVTDVGGYYRLNVAPGTYRLSVNAVGYAQQDVASLTVTAGAVTTTNITVRPVAFELTPISVSVAPGVPEKVTEAPASVSVVTERQIRERPVATVVEHLRETPGVDIITAGVQSRNIVARGFNNIFSGALQTLTDNRIAGVPSLRVNFLHFIPQTDEDIGRMEVVLGPAAALYGPNTANGVLHILTRSPFEQQGTTISVSGGQQDFLHGTFRTSHLVSNRFGFKVSGQYLTATEWNYRDASEDSTRAALGTPAAAALFPATMPEAERQRRAARIAARDFDIRRWGGDVRADFRATERLNVIFTGGMTNNDGIELTGIGAGQAVDWRYSYLQVRSNYGRLFAQTYLNFTDAGETFLLRNGAPISDRSRVWVSQVQHRTDFGPRQTLAYGADYVRTEPRTEGTVTGRNEDNDIYNEVGAYIQSQTTLHRMLDLVLAGRADKHSELQDVVFSPRAALVFKPRQDHTLRFTYNRAFSTPTTLNLFLDIDAGPLGPLGPLGYRAHAQAPGRDGIRLRGADGTLRIRTPFASLNPAEAQALRSISPAAIYDYQVEAIRRAAALPPQLAGAMLTFKGDPAFAQIPMVLLDPLTSKAIPYSAGAVNDVAGIRESTTSTFEVGYKGLLANRILLAADIWHQNQKNFTSPLVTATPVVLMAPQQLAAFMVPRLTAVLMATGMPQAQAQAQATLIASNMVRLPGGVIASEQTSGQGAAMIVTYRNFGSVDLSGMDLAATVLLTEQFQLGVTGSLVSDDFYRLPLGERDSTVVTLNAPKRKGSASLTYRNLDGGFNGQVRVRHTAEFPANSAGYVGLRCADPTLQGECVQAYTLVDLLAGYQLPFRGASLQLAVNNALDKPYRSFIGVPEIGRMATLRLRYEF